MRKLFCDLCGQEIVGKQKMYLAMIPEIVAKERGTKNHIDKQPVRKMELCAACTESLITEPQPETENSDNDDIWGAVITENSVTRYYHIHNMTIGEMAQYMTLNANATICNCVCDGLCTAIDSLIETSDKKCKKLILEWLRSPMSEKVK